MSDHLLQQKLWMVSSTTDRHDPGMDVKARINCTYAEVPLFHDFHSGKLTVSRMMLG